jgi:hypothetical protein
MLSSWVNTPIMLSDDMTWEEKTAIEIENARNLNADRVIKAMAEDEAVRESIVDAILGSEQGSSTDDISSSSDSHNPAMMFGAPRTYMYPRFDPGCTAYSQIRNYLFSQRQALALDSLHFDIQEHVLLAYINRNGFHIGASVLRGFLLECDRRGELFMYLFPMHHV